MNRFILFIFHIFLLTQVFFPFAYAKGLNKKENLKKFDKPLNLEVKESWRDEYNKALELYNKGKYEDAAKIFDDIVPLMVLNKEIIDARLKQSYCSFHKGDYMSSIYQFEEFYNDYNNSKYAEEALYMLGLSNSKFSGSIHSDQSHTEEAIYIFKDYLKIYPQGKYKTEVENNLEQMLIKIYKKELDIVNTYFILEYYTAAKKILAGFINEIPNSNLALEAKWTMLNILYYDAYYSKNEWPKWTEAMGYCLEFISDNADTKYIKKANKIYNNIKKTISKLEANI